MAEVSGPGQFSQRTDKAVTKANETLPNAGYGEAQDYQEQKSAAPIGRSPGGLDFAALFGNPADRVTGLGEPTAEPGVPVTNGAALGAGAGSEALNTKSKTDKAYSAAYMVALEFLANQPGSSDAARNLVRSMKASM